MDYETIEVLDIRELGWHHDGPEEKVFDWWRGEIKTQKRLTYGWYSYGYRVARVHHPSCEHVKKREPVYLSGYIADKSAAFAERDRLRKG